MNFIVLFLSLCFSNVSFAMSDTQSLGVKGNVSQPGHFIYRGNVSYSDTALLISEIPPGEVKLSLGYCAMTCLSNLDCNAVELCSTSTGNMCRLSREITKSLTTGNHSCSRYEMVSIN